MYLQRQHSKAKTTFKGKDDIQNAKTTFKPCCYITVDPASPAP